MTSNDPLKLAAEARVEANTPGWGATSGLVRDLADAIEALVKERDALRKLATDYRERDRTNYPGGCFSTFDNPRFPNNYNYDHRCGICTRYDALAPKQESKE